MAVQGETETSVRRRLDPEDNASRVAPDGASAGVWMPSRFETREHESLASPNILDRRGGDDRAEERRAVLVLGMHRSGTSVVTGTFTRLGLGGPASPVPPNSDNPAGFYESTQIVDLNDRILTALGSNYHDWRKVEPRGLGAAALDAFVAEAARCYQAEYGHTGLAAVKDPRMCRLVPLWRRALDGIGVKVRVAIVFRSPVEVTSSLNKRNGFSAANGLLIWLRHVLDSERHTRDVPRCFVAMDEFIDDWRQAIARISESLDIRWPRYDDGVAAEIDGYVSKPLRHNVSRPAEIASLHRWAGELSGALESLVADPHAPDAIAVLDRVADQFDTACELFSKPTQEGYDWALGLLGARNLLQARLDDIEGRTGPPTEPHIVETDPKVAAPPAQGERASVRRPRPSAPVATPAVQRGGEPAASQIGRLQEAISLRTRYVTRLEAKYDAERAASLKSEDDRARLDADVARLTRELEDLREQFVRATAEREETPIAVERTWLSPLASLGTKLGAVTRAVAGSSTDRSRPPAHPDVDPDWYRARYPDVQKSGDDPQDHYIRFGQHEGRFPGASALNPHFDTDWYVAQHGDTTDLGVEPYAHYLRVGAAEGRDPSPVFSTNGYLAAHPDVRESGINPLEHYWKYGAAEQRLVPLPELPAERVVAETDEEDGDAPGNATEDFDAAWYLERYRDVRAASVDPYEHYRDHGRAEGRLAGPAALNPHFDTDWYVAQYGDTTDLGVEPYAHYLRVGAAEGRDPSPVFSTNGYLAAYPDVCEGGINPLEHYWKYGAAEQRLVPLPELPAESVVAEADEEDGDAPVNATEDLDAPWYLERYKDVRAASVDPHEHYRDHGRAEGRLAGPAALNPHFDTDWYVAQYGDTTDLGVEPYAHYLRVGAAEGRDPSPVFSTNGYLAAYPDVRESGINPLEHYWHCGEGEQRATQISASAHVTTAQANFAARAAVFDREYYLSLYPDIEYSRVDPWEHYLAHGEREGRLPNEIFDGVFYKDVYADVRNSGGSPFRHYQTAGLQEHRLPAAANRPVRNGGARLLFIGHDSFAAGAQRVLLEIIIWFQRHTLYDVSVLLLGPGHLTTDYAQIARTYTVGNDIAAEAENIRRFVGSSPDVVYCNTVLSGRALIPQLSDLFSKSIVIAHCHELANIIRQFPGPFEALCGRADRWISASPATTNLLQAEPALRDRSIDTVQAFIRPSVLSTDARAALRASERKALGIAGDACVVVGCGTVHWRKDPALFVETATTVLSRQNGLDIHFVWIGDGEDVAELRGIIASVGLADRVQITGYRSDAADLICIADVFFLSSVEDPFPLVVLEAGQFGIPVVCFDGATGMTDLVSRCGRVVPERSAGLAADALLELLGDAPLRSWLGNNLRKEVLGKYVTDVQIPQILNSLRDAGAKPAVSIVVPNYNHAEFLDLRIRSLLAQTIQDFEIIVLDDASQDDSLAVIGTFTTDPRIRLVINEHNSGSSFRQWQRGVALAQSDVVWIAESDDSCEARFLEILGPYMLRGDVSIAFGQTVIMDSAGTEMPGALKPYLDRMAPDFGETAFTRSGAAFVNDGFGAICAIVNASGALLRRSAIERALPDACEFAMCGDWRVYLEAMTGGSVAYDPTAINYFRRHASSTVHRLEGTNTYFKERLNIASYVAANFRTTPAIRHRMQVELDHEAARFEGRYDSGLDVDLAQTFASSPHPDYVDGRVHVVFYVHGMLFSKGGIERLFSVISTTLVDRGFKVSLVCAPYGKSAVPVFPLRPEVEITTADITVPAGVAKLRRGLETRQVDVFVPMLSEDLFEKVFEAAEGLGIPIVASEHNNPNMIETLWWSRERRLACFEKADAIHLVAEVFETSLPDALRAKVQVIPHPILPEFACAARRPSEPLTIVAVGRLAKQKRFDLLIKAFARLSEDFPDWRLDIYGEGAERPQLYALIQALDLSDRISLPGITSDMVDVLEQASLFVMSSAFEATGLALVEALAAGLPVVAFAACEGNGDLIEDGVNGLLAREFTPSSLAGAMRTMMVDPAFRERCGDQARRIMTEFGLVESMDKWECLIRSQVEARSNRDDGEPVA